MTRALHGTILGRTIQLDEDPGIPDGQEVDVVVTAAPLQKQWGAGIERSAGVAANVPEFAEVFAQVERDRKAARFREPGR